MVILGHLLKLTGFNNFMFSRVLARNQLKKSCDCKSVNKTICSPHQLFVLTRGMVKIIKQKLISLLIINYCIYINTIIVSLFICSSIIVSFEK
jgi:hypothetical protein